jgi:hypothetical protein
MNLACPGCGFRTIESDGYGSYDICSVCGWEDDAVQLANPCSEGGANRESLHEHQRAFRVDNVPDGIERDQQWRPLNEDEVTYLQRAKNRQHWAFMGETAPEFAYWLKARTPSAEE